MDLQTRSVYDDVSVEQMRTRGTAKWTHYGADILAAWVAEMDFPLAPPLRSALVDAVDRSCAGYAPADDETGLPQACVDWLAETTGLRVDPEQVRILPDVLKGLELAITAFSPPGSPVIVPTPSYPPFFTVVEVCDRPIVEAPMIDEGGRHRLDLDAIERALAAGATSLILCNPHNPLGRAFSRDELRALAEIVQAAGARVVADEVHGPLTYQGSPYTPYASVSSDAAGHSVTLMSASKGWNVPGLKCAQLLLTNPADAATWGQLARLHTHGASILGIIANKAAYSSGRPWLAETVTYLDSNRQLLAELLTAHLPGIRYWKPEGTYLAWLDCRPLGIDHPSAFFLERARVGTNDGASFRGPGAGFVRLNFATSTAMLERIVEAMAGAVRAR